MTLTAWLAERERLANAATAGPWRYMPGVEGAAGFDLDPGIRGADGFYVATVAVDCHEGLIGANGGFIADARESLPRLVEMVRVLSEALRMIRPGLPWTEHHEYTREGACYCGRHITDRALARIEAIAAESETT